MLIKLIRWIKGYVRFEIKGRFPERFINLCLRQGRILFDTGPMDSTFMGCLLISDYRDIRRFAKRSGVVLRIRERHGLPFFLQKHRSRSGLVVGGVLFLAIVVLMQNFVWTIDINGLETLSETQIRSLLREKGLYEGAYKGNLNVYSIQRKIMGEVDEIGWMSINVSGTKIEAEIKEKAPIPEMEQTDIPCNLKADRDGIILSMNVKQGATRFKVGSGVLKGQTLVSGILPNNEKGASLVHADADVIAATEHTITKSVNRVGMYNKPVEVIKRCNLRFLWMLVPYNFSSAPEPYTSRVVVEKVNMNSTDIFLGRVTEYCTLYETNEYSLDDEQTKELLNAEDYLYRLFSLKDCLKIEATMSVSMLSDKGTAYIKYSCQEDITEKEMIVVN